MNLRQIQDIAGHRDVPPWVIKLVQDCIEHERTYENKDLTIAYMCGYEKGKDAGELAEREACAKMCKWVFENRYTAFDLEAQEISENCAAAIRARNTK